MSYLHCSAESRVGKKGYVLILNDRRFQKKTSFIISVFPTQRLHRTNYSNITQQMKLSDVKWLNVAVLACIPATAPHHKIKVYSQN